MRNTVKKIMSLLLVLAIIASLNVPALAGEVTKGDAYDGNVVDFKKADGESFGMFAAQSGTTCAIVGDNVVIHYVPKNITTYSAIHWGAINDDKPLSKDVVFNKNGSFDITVSKEFCGYKIPVAPLKSNGTTTDYQYYLCIPQESKLQGITTPTNLIIYNGEELKIVTENGVAVEEFAPQEGSSCTSSSNNMILHYVLPATATNLYSNIHKGKITDVPLSENSVAIENGAFDITYTKWECGYLWPIAPFKGENTTNEQYYLAVPAQIFAIADYRAVDAALAKVPADLSIYTDETAAAVTAAVNVVVRNYKADKQKTVDGMANSINEAVSALVKKDGGSGSSGSGETPDSSVELVIKNNTGMFKVASASLETSGSSTYLVVLLNSDGYHDVFKGTYEEAVRNGANTDNWIHGTEKPEEKYEFRIPVSENENYIPLVAISFSYYDKYRYGKNTLERSFYPRQLEINRNTKTLVTGDYDNTVTMTLSSNVSGFGVRSSASVHVVGGPNSNNYKVETTLSMTDDKFDQITYPTVKDGKISTDTASLSNNTFTISLTNAPTLTAFKDGESFDITLREKESGKNVSAYMTINLLEKTIKITATSISSPGGAPDTKKDEENKEEEKKTDTPAVTETLKPEAKADASGSAKATVEAKAVADAVKSAAEKKADSIVIAPEVSGDAKEVKVELPKASVSEIAKSTDAALVVETDKGSVELPNDTLAEIAEQAGGANVEISVADKSVEDAGVKEAIAEKLGDDVKTDNAAVAEITVTSGDEKITSFGGKTINAKVSVDGKKGFAEGKKYLTLVISENGKRELLAGKCSKGADGKLNVGVKVGHLSTFVVLDKELKSFADAEAHWSADAVDFAVANGLMNGTSETAFAPNMTLNRAMLVTILYRLAGSPVAMATDKFTDVAAGQWYSEAVAWAAANGIVIGKTETTFAPMDNITREQFATMLMRYCKFAGVDTTAAANLGAFTDSASISSYAKDALAWANASGIITGRTATTIAPTGSATRGEAATMLMRFMQM